MLFLSAANQQVGILELEHTVRTSKGLQCSLSKQRGCESTKKKCNEHFHNTASPHFRCNARRCVSFGTSAQVSLTELWIEPQQVLVQLRATRTGLKNRSAER